MSKRFRRQPYGIEIGKNTLSPENKQIVPKEIWGGLLAAIESLDGDDLVHSLELLYMKRSWLRCEWIYSEFGFVTANQSFLQEETSVRIVQARQLHISYRCITYIVLR